jgi:HSP20 family protein
MNEPVSTSDRHQEVAARRTSQYYVTPLVDVRSTSESIVLHAEMPGVDKTGVDITVEDGNLVLVGHRLPLNVPGDPLYVERRALDYRRVY